MLFVTTQNTILKRFLTEVGEGGGFGWGGVEGWGEKADNCN